MSIDFGTDKTLFVNGPVFTGDGEILPNGEVTVESGRIVRVAHAKSEPYADANVVDLTGNMLLPGFIDCHVHLYLEGNGDPFTPLAQISPQALALQAASRAADTLMAGITTVRDMGDMHGVVRALRDAVKQGLLPGPRILAAGAMICMTGGHGWHIGGRQADGPDEVRKAVREQVRAGCDVVKLMATGGVLTPGGQPGQAHYTLDELRAGVEEAHRLGRKAGAHAQGTEGIKNSLHAGMDTIEHGIFLDREAIDLMLEKDAALVPTLSVPMNMMRAGEKGGVPAWAMDSVKRVKQAHFDSFEKAAQSGVRLAMGTDAGTPHTPHGTNLGELALMASSGCTPAQALLAATSGAAKALGLDELGIIAPGNVADLVVAKGDPLGDPGLLADPAKILYVMKEGRMAKAPA